MEDNPELLKKAQKIAALLIGLCQDNDIINNKIAKLEKRLDSVSSELDELRGYDA